MVITISQASKQDIFEYTHVHEDKIEVINNGRNLIRAVWNQLPLKIIGISDCDEFQVLQEVKGQIACYKYIASNEEMQLKTAVICSGISSLPEVVGDAALLVNPTDYEEVAAAMEKLSQDEVLQGELIESGSKNVERFTWDKIVKQYWKALVG